MTAPAPPVPPECTMEGNDWFPLYFDRLRKSKWWRRASDLARARNVMLWGEAYKAVPAGSLPDDDDELAEAAGFGMDVDAFLVVKTEIMAPWVLCSDGRWYHPTTCEVVLDAWERKSERRRKEAEKKRDQRSRARGVPAQTPDVPRDIEHVPEDNSGNGRDIATQTLQTGQDNRDADASLSPRGDSPQLVLIAETPAPAPEEPAPSYPPAFEAAWKAYPHVKGRSSKPKALGFWRRLSAATRDALPAAIVRYAREGREPRQECGAPAMDRWLRDNRFEDWISPSAPAQPSATADPLTVWRFRIGQFVEKRFWREQWGVQPRREAPQREGVQVPDEILSEFGFPTASRSAA